MERLQSLKALLSDFYLLFLQIDVFPPNYLEREFIKQTGLDVVEAGKHDLLMARLQNLQGPSAHNICIIQVGESQKKENNAD